MTLDAVIIAFGAFVALLPFLQFPLDWTNFFSFIAGIVIVGLGIAVRRRGLGHNPAFDQAKLFDSKDKEQQSE